MPRKTVYTPGLIINNSVNTLKGGFLRFFPGRTLFRVLLRLPALLIFAGIWFLSSQSVLPRPKGILGFDKVQHLLAFAALAAASGFWVPGSRWRSRPGLSFLMVAVLVSVYGLVDEVHQFFVPGRDCNIWDWIADTLGAFLGTAAALFVFRLRFTRRKDGPGA
jgi:VanZ family protein